MNDVEGSVGIAGLGLGNLREDFSRAAAEFALMQQEHLAALADGNCGDVLSWQQRREEVFRALARQLERITGDGQADGDCVVLVKATVKKLLDAEKILDDCLAVRRARIKEQLAAMHKGKDALQGYSMNKGAGPKPRYLSSRT